MVNVFILHKYLFLCVIRVIILLAAYSCYGDAIPRHQAPLEKTAVLGVCNPSERLHVKWRETLQRRKDRDSRLRARRDGRALNQIIAASVQACDRLGCSGYYHWSVV